jgi:Uma2 family endonuclease
MTLQTEPTVPARTSATLSYEQFLEVMDGEHVEWVRGEIINMAPISDEHQDLGLFLLAVLRPFVEFHKLGKLRYEPFQMKAGPDLPGRSPDILFVATANLGRLQRTFLDGPADMVVEIISPDSQSRDRGEKFSEYERGGVREYWLLDPLRKQADFYTRGDDGIFRLLAISDGVFRSNVLPGFWLKTDWLWQAPLPGTIGVLKELGLI